MEVTYDARLQWGGQSPSSPSGQKSPLSTSTVRRRTQCVCERCFNKKEPFANVKIPKGEPFSAYVQEALLGLMKKNKENP